MVRVFVLHLRQSKNGRFVCLVLFLFCYIYFLGDLSIIKPSASEMGINDNYV